MQMTNLNGNTIYATVLICVNIVQVGYLNFHIKFIGKFLNSLYNNKCTYYGDLTVSLSQYHVTLDMLYLVL